MFRLSDRLHTNQEKHVTVLFLLLVYNKFMKESVAQKQVIELFESLGWIVVRFNGGRKGKISFFWWKYLGDSSTKGLSDLLLMKNGRVVFVEMKGEGGKPRPDQLKFFSALDSEGIEHRFSKGIDDLEDLLGT